MSKCRRNKLHQDDLIAVALRSFDIVMPVHSLIISEQALRCRPRLRPHSTVPCMMVLQVLCHVTWPNQAIFQSLIVARRDF